MRSGPGSEQLSDERDQHQNQPVAQTVSDTVDERRAHRILHGKGLGSTHHDAVRDDQTDEDRELLRQGERVSLEHLIDQNNQ